MLAYPLTAGEQRILRWVCRVVPVAAATVVALLAAMSWAASPV